MPQPASAESPNLDLWYREQVLVHESALRSYLRRSFPIVTDPDNIVQETFARALASQQAGGIVHARGFLFTTARNLALGMIRRRGIVSIDSIAEVEDLGISSDDPGVPEQVARKFDLELLQQAIQSLPDRCREVLTLRKIEGLSQREIAQRLGIAEHTVEVQVANGMRRCAQFFRQHGHMPAERQRA